MARTPYASTDAMVKQLTNFWLCLRIKHVKRLHDLPLALAAFTIGSDFVWFPGKAPIVSPLLSLVLGKAFVVCEGGR